MGAKPAQRSKMILVGVCGGIAAYKCAGIVSTLRQDDWDVHVIMTDSAQRFVSKLTFAALSNNDVHTDMFAADSTWDIAHIGLVRSAELMLVLNATANTLAKLAHGAADNLLTACVLATRRPVLVAPAMNTAMWEAEPTQANVLALQRRGYQFITPGAGFLACGEVGEGRLADEREILDAVRQTARRSSELHGQRVVITAGPTREFADPARFLSNPSTGRMGFALASEAALRGAAAIVVHGPTEVKPPAGVSAIPVTSAREMHAAVIEHLTGAAIFIGAAAVADFRPETARADKVKKEEAGLTMTLTRNPDILADVAAHRPPGCFIVGFAAETDDVERKAREKLERKQLDCIVANRIGSDGAGFASATNEAIILWGDGGREVVERTSKAAVAGAIFDRIARLRSAT